ncbi:hypothetical protein [Nocardia transvalensis]|uniref:hypothetical protein n=1 Tax=Nocardia transvalensis TaxID=37333 RepID=UPI001893B85A|nr:hypothetical protein [Nocardia transvalensis]MBF6331109.1 hypothetical protein [Nocardia transvalensis]
MLANTADDLDAPRGIAPDPEIDTNTTTIEDCSAQIKAFLDRGPAQRVFDQLRAHAKL